MHGGPGLPPVGSAIQEPDAVRGHVIDGPAGDEDQGAEGGKVELMAG